jgi:hypothetical protein
MKEDLFKPWHKLTPKQRDLLIEYVFESEIYEHHEKFWVNVYDDSMSDYLTALAWGASVLDKNYKISKELTLEILLKRPDMQRVYPYIVDYLNYE